MRLVKKVKLKFEEDYAFPFYDLKSIKEEIKAMPTGKENYEFRLAADEPIFESIVDDNYILIFKLKIINKTPVPPISGLRLPPPNSY